MQRRDGRRRLVPSGNHPRCIFRRARVSSPEGIGTSDLYDRSAPTRARHRHRSIAGGVSSASGIRALQACDAGMMRRQTGSGTGSEPFSKNSGGKGNEADFVARKRLSPRISTMVFTPTSMPSLSCRYRGCRLDPGTEGAA